jgi:hypothetical protein
MVASISADYPGGWIRHVPMSLSFPVDPRGLALPWAVALAEAEGRA